MQTDEIINDGELRPKCVLDPIEKSNYPLKEIVKVRELLLTEIYETSSEILAEISAKRKCGLLTNEVLEYYINGKKPANFQETFEIVNDYLSEFETANTNEQDNKQQTKEQGFIQITSPAEASTSKAIEQLTTVTSFESTPLMPFQEPSKFDINIINAQIKSLCRTLNLSHGCEVENFKFCPKQIITNDVTDLNLSSIYVCDNCQVVNNYKENMLKHLSDSKHLSASEYYIDKSANDNIYQPNSRIKYIKSRSSIENAANLTEKAVFCPKCNFCFSKSVIACGLHYRYEHNVDEYVYALADLKRTEKITIEKSHSCFECKRKFKKLSELTGHLEGAKHFPKNPQQEISVLLCPFDRCGFKSIHFFSFKTHLLTHPFFQRPINEMPEISVSVIMYVYSKPTNLFHMCPLGDSVFENNDELKCIEALLDNIRGHSDCSETVKKVRCRKDCLYRNIVKK